MPTPVSDRTLVRDSRGVFHVEVRIASIRSLKCEADLDTHPVIDLPDDVCEEQLCEFCWPRWPNDCR